MYQAVEVVVKQGVVVPLEAFTLEEDKHYLLVPLPSARSDRPREADRMAAFDAMRGKYRDSLPSVDEFIARKAEEKALER
jgi:hypothetical protein